MSSATVSVVVVNLNGRHHLETCLQSLVDQDYPPHLVEVILVDNGSSDGSVPFVNERFPAVRILRNERNVGFAPAVNQGAAAATGAYLALINNDTRLDPHWIATMVNTLEAHRERGVVCVGSRILDWEGKRIDFIGGGSSFYGFGYQMFYDLPVEAINPGEHESLFACGGAMLVDRAIFLDVGGFDEDFFAYYEDIDFGWRLWLLGYRVLITPSAIVYHRHHGTSSRMREAQMYRLFERNAIMMVIKNYEEAHLYRALSASFLMMFQRIIGYTNGAVPWEGFHFEPHDPPSALAEQVMVPAQALSAVAGMKDVLEQFPGLWEKRQRIQARRARSDAEIFPLFRNPFSMHYKFEVRPLLTRLILDALGVTAMLSTQRKRRVLIVSSDPVSAHLAGVGIRAVELARGLSAVCEVTLAAPDQATLELPGVQMVAFERDDQQLMANLVEYAEIVIVQGYTLRRYPVVGSLDKYLIVDLYDPYYLEGLAFFAKEGPIHGRAGTHDVLDTIARQLIRGDFFLCASERQRDLWLGVLLTLGRLDLPTYVQDQTFRSLIDVVPFGCPETPPEHTRQVLKGVVPGIAATDTVILWGGGIWDWLDPLTVIRAMALVRAQRPDLKLFFLGSTHPNTTDVPEMQMYGKAVALAEELDVLGHTVFFNDHWVPYAERANYLLEADIGVSAHLEHIETRFAFRTRMLDYIWAGLPMVVTAGDTLADTVAQRGLGYVVPIGDPVCFAQALLDLAREPEPRQRYAAAFASARAACSWQRALEPLIAFCANPRYAADRTFATTALPPPPPAANREAELDAVIAEKNAHIAHLEDLIRRLESGRVMRVLGLIERLRRPRRTGA
jgi:GT2 family glycosyltransferase/glycosyltransferase involved in cell wall biosynthesis